MIPPLPYSYCPHSDKLRDECGVFGIFQHPDAAALTVLGLHALQHRGQESAGIVSFDGEQFYAERAMGLVNDAFGSERVMQRLKGNTALGHVRYSTQGHSNTRNMQPLYADLFGGGVACAHNGNLTNAQTLRHRLVQKGAMFQSTSDTEVLLQLFSRSRRTRTLRRFLDALFQLQGAYAFVVITNKKLIGARDPLGIRPLVLGQRDGAYVLASESCALDIIDAKFVREIDPGEVVVITEDGLESHHPFPKVPPRPCIFEYIYFSRPDSMLGGKSVYACRKAFGSTLAKEQNNVLAKFSPEDSFVAPVPDSGVPAALGFAQEAGLPFESGIIRSHYMGRSFIEPKQHIRQYRVKLKHNINKACVKGKNVFLVDDSIVRGTTSKKIVAMLRDAGAKSVHMQVACPPIKHHDFYGIDTPRTDELLAALQDQEAMRDFIGVDSLHFLSLAGLYTAMGYEKRNDAQPQFTDHCFTGDYPTPLLDDEQPNINQPSLLAEHRSD